ncbi:Morn repeat [Brachionus plicatilis]|uniref:Morn repeat n=1 Tax=Brachionus plicatilis TaxID=10195 RepID=A0A3M7PGY0_BRAPC|nr:Morn repeat [Brachionus plicatilis]
MAEVSIFANGNKYEGECKDDKRNGRGVFFFANGDKYERDYKDGKMNEVKFHSNVNFIELIIMDSDYIESLLP